jgi:hypothetical protein
VFWVEMNAMIVSARVHPTDLIGDGMGVTQLGCAPSDGLIPEIAHRSVFEVDYDFFAFEFKNLFNDSSCHRNILVVPAT